MPAITVAERTRLAIQGEQVARPGRLHQAAGAAAKGGVFRGGPRPRPAAFQHGQQGFAGLQAVRRNIGRRLHHRQRLARIVVDGERIVAGPKKYGHVTRHRRIAMPKAGHHRAQVRIIVARRRQHRVLAQRHRRHSTRQRVIDHERMIVIGIRHRTNDGQLIGLAGQARQMLADVNSRHAGGDGPERAANLGRGQRFEVPHGLVRRPAEEVNHNARFGPGETGPRRRLGWPRPLDPTGKRQPAKQTAHTGLKPLATVHRPGQIGFMRAS